LVIIPAGVRQMGTTAVICHEMYYSHLKLNLRRGLSVVQHMAARNALPHHARSASVPGTRGVATVTSALLMRAPAHVVYAFLARLPNHGLITGRRLRLESVTADGAGARIAMRGPLGIRRTARTRVTYLHPPCGFGGTAAVGRRTEAYVHWRIERAGTGSLVTLTATILRAGAVDRLLLTLGGRRWLGRSFDRALALLSVAMESALDADEPYARMAG
jgi:hypothetical protein